MKLTRTHGDYPQINRTDLDAFIAGFGLNPRLLHTMTVVPHCVIFEMYREDLDGKPVVSQFGLATSEWRFNIIEDRDDGTTGLVVQTVRP